MRHLLTGLAIFMCLTSALAAPGVQVWQVAKPLDTTYDAVYQALEQNRFFVVFEPNIGKNLEGFAKRWGEDYNRNRLEGIRAMVFCNAWYANQVSNQDPELLALCPLHLTFTHKEGVTRILFLRPTHIAGDSQAAALAAELEGDVAKAVQAGIEAAGKGE
jgi:uncharacterized protein (DUF302 family)